MRYSKLFSVARFTLGVISQVLVYTTATYLQPTLAIHLTSYGYKGLFIGMSFAIPTLIYAVSSPMIFVLTKKFRKSAVIFVGYGIISVGMFLVGPSQLLRIIDSEIITMIGLCIMGLGCGMIIIPVMPEMIEAAIGRYP